MSENQEYIDKKYQNVFADTVDGKSIHISQAESGRKGYFCQGCKKQLEAVKHTVQNRIDYFRHVPFEVKYEQKCTYRDETYRHKLAKEALARLKHIKVPAVYKYPPKGEDGYPNLIAESVLIEAHSVEMERVFYEDEAGEIRWGSGSDVDEKYLLVRPDVVFFDAEKKPILFIELVATHKADNEKKAKLRLLGINAIEISIPRDSAAGIEAALYQTKRIKWLYNYVEQSTKYISIPNPGAEGISPIDEQQKRLFAETFECRQAEVRNLIRTIKRVLESKQFGDTIQKLGEDLSRVKGNTEEHQSKLDALREEYRNRANKSVEPKNEEFRAKLEEFERRKSEFQKQAFELENRYNAKRGKLENENANIDEITSGASKGGGDIKSRIERRRAEIRRLTTKLQYAIGSEEAEIDSLQREEDGLPERFAELRKSIIAKFAALEANEKREMEEYGHEEAGLPKEFEEKERTLSDEFEGDKEQARIEFEGAREEFNKITKSRDGSGTTSMHYRIRGLLEARKLFDDIGKTQGDNKRNRTAWECFKNGTYENWME